MILSEVLKKLLELKIRFVNNGVKIEDIQTVDHDNYGYIIALASAKDDAYEELLRIKMRELNGKRVMPDLWVLGPFVKEDKNDEKDNKFT